MCNWYKMQIEGSQNFWVSKTPKYQKIPHFFVLKLRFQVILKQLFHHASTKLWMWADIWWGGGGSGSCLGFWFWINFNINNPTKRHPAWSIFDKNCAFFFGKAGKEKKILVQDWNVKVVGNEFFKKKEGTSKTQIIQRCGQLTPFDQTIRQL